MNIKFAPFIIAVAALFLTSACSSIPAKAVLYSPTNSAYFTTNEDVPVYAKAEAKKKSRIERVELFTNGAFFLETDELSIETNISKPLLGSNEITIIVSGKRIESFSTNLTFISEPLVELVKVPAGQFLMGSRVGLMNESPVRSVTISSFYIAKHETTYKQWKRVYERALTMGYDFDNEGSMERASNPSNSEHPVNMINWYDMVKWCNAASEIDERSPVYYTDSSKGEVYRSGRIDLPYADFEADGYRLPTEAEWEYACRGGTNSKFYWGDSYATAILYAWYGRNSKFMTHPVGLKKANGYGIHDMNGNVWEWCWDNYVKEYDRFDNIDPKGSVYNTGNKVGRGGGAFYSTNEIQLRPQTRGWDSPDLCDFCDGFRVAASIPD